MNYLNDNIIFLKEDTKEQKLTKVVHIFAGSHQLKTELKKEGIENYSKVCKGAKTSYILRSAKLGKIVVTL